MPSSPKPSTTRQTSDTSEPAPTRRRSTSRSTHAADSPGAYSIHSQVAPGSRSPDPQASGTRAAEAGDGRGAQCVVLPPIHKDLPLHLRPAEAMRLASEAFAQTGYWIAFYRAILGPRGVIHRLFPSEGEMDYFESTREFEEIHKILTALRGSDAEKAESIEPQKMITLRIPKSLQAALVDEAERFATSVNKLCISKLLMPIRSQFVPAERGKVRGRKPRR